jgi:hypothetical protein
MNSSSGDFWYVKLSDGDVHRVTLDQLDEAFQAGHIDGDTMVLAGGASEWTRLASLAGMDEEEEVPVEAALHAAAEAPAHYIPQRPVPHFVQQPGVRPMPTAPAAAPVRPAVMMQPVPQIAAPMAYSPRPIIPPVVAPSLRPVTPNTLRPISMDFSDDPDLMPRRRGGAAKWVGALVAIAALGGVGAFAATTRPTWAQPILNRLGVHSPAPAMAAAVAPPPPPAPEPAPPPAPLPVAAAPVPAPPPGAQSSLSPHFTDTNDKLTDDQKTRLAAADKQHAKGGGHKGGGHAAAPARGSSSKGKSSTFTTTGSKYDPLNSSI